MFSKTKRRVAADYAEEADCDMIAYENGSLGLLPITFVKLYTENMDINLFYKILFKFMKKHIKFNNFLCKTKN